MFFKKATDLRKIFTVDLTLCSKSQIDGEDFVNFYGLLRKYELYLLSSLPLQNGCFIICFVKKVDNNLQQSVKVIKKTKLT